MRCLTISCILCYGSKKTLNTSLEYDALTEAKISILNIIQLNGYSAHYTLLILGHYYGVI